MFLEFVLSDYLRMLCGVGPQTFALEQGDVARSLEQRCLEIAQKNSFLALGLHLPAVTVPQRAPLLPPPNPPSSAASPSTSISLEAMDAVLQLGSLSLKDESEVWDAVLSWGRSAPWTILSPTEVMLSHEEGAFADRRAISISRILWICPRRKWRH